jgi:hypothetical protein
MRRRSVYGFRKPVMPPILSRRAALAAAAGLTGCIPNILSPAAGFLGSPLEYDRKWFVVHNGGRLVAELLGLAKAGAPKEKFEALRLHLGAIDAAGREVVSFTDGVSVTTGVLLGEWGSGIAGLNLFTAVQPHPRASFSMEKALGDSVEVTGTSHSGKGNVAVDFVAGKLLRDRTPWPEGAEVDGLAPAKDQKTKRMGYIDGLGVFRIPPRYGKALAFHGGFARVADEQGNFGLIDPKGELVVPQRYRFLSRTANGISAFQTVDAGGIVNTSNREQRAPGASAVLYEGGDYALLRVPDGLLSSRWVIVSAKDGKHAALPAGLNQAMLTTHGAIARRGRDQPWMLFDGDAKSMGEKKWTDAMQSYRGLVQAADGDLAGWMDGQGKWIVEPRYTHLGAFEFGWATFQKKGDTETVGMVSMEGREILQGRLLRASCLGRVIVAVEPASNSQYRLVHYSTNGNKLRESAPAAPLGR